MRCVASSPAAAAQALRTRLSSARVEEDPDAILNPLLDGSEDDLTQDDVTPAADTGEPALHALLQQAEALAGAQDDPKLHLLTAHLQRLLDDGFNPVVFCRYIATAHYLYDALKEKFRGVAVDVVTGEFPPEERERRVQAMGDRKSTRLNSSHHSRSYAVF